MGELKIKTDTGTFSDAVAPFIKIDETVWTEGYAVWEKMDFGWVQRWKKFDPYGFVPWLVFATVNGVRGDHFFPSEGTRVSAVATDTPLGMFRTKAYRAPGGIWYVFHVTVRPANDDYRRLVIYKTTEANFSNILQAGNKYYDQGTGYFWNRHLQVDHYRQLLYWSDIVNDKNHVVCANFDGSNRQTIMHWTSDLNPAEFAIDRTANLLFTVQIDGQFAKTDISSFGREYEQHAVMLHKEPAGIFGIGCRPSEKRLYWVDVASRQMYSVNYDGTDKRPVPGVITKDGGGTELFVDDYENIIYKNASGNYMIIPKGSSTPLQMSGTSGSGVNNLCTDYNIQPTHGRPGQHSAISIGNGVWYNPATYPGGVGSRGFHYVNTFDPNHPNPYTFGGCSNRNINGRELTVLGINDSNNLELCLKSGFGTNYPKTIKIHYVHDGVWRMHEMYLSSTTVYRGFYGVQFFSRDNSTELTSWFRSGGGVRDLFFEFIY